MVSLYGLEGLGVGSACIWDLCGISQSFITSL